MRLSNGFGSVTKLKGNRRNPYRVRKTVSCEIVDGKAIQKMINIGYYPTKEAALEALINYNRDPYSIEDKVSFSGLYERWSDEHFPKVSRSNISGYRAAYKLCYELYDIPFVDLRLSHLQGVIDSCGKNYPTLKKLKILFTMMYSYARKHEICMIDRARDVDIYQYRDKNPNKIDRYPFSEDEIEKLWIHQDGNLYVQLVLIMIYTGVRLGELRNLKKENVNMDEYFFDITKSKTPAGIRKVPIADKIYPFFQNWMERESEYMFPNLSGAMLQDKSFRECYWDPVMEVVGSYHHPHDTRHTCVSLLTKAGADERYIKRIVGHAGKGVTENVYTHIEIEELRKVVNMI